MAARMTAAPVQVCTGGDPTRGVHGLLGYPWMPGSHTPSHFDLLIRKSSGLLLMPDLLPFGSEHNQCASMVVIMNGPGVPGSN